VLLPLGCSRSATDSLGRSKKIEGDLGSEKVPAKTGLCVNDPRAFQGYTLLVPMMSARTYLIDMDGKIVRTWESDRYPALSAYFLDNGHLLRTGSVDMDKRPFGGPGAGGRIQEFSWEGELVWDFTFSNAKQLPHHDVAKLPNGNVLMIVWESKTWQESTAAGRRSQPTGRGAFRLDCIIEVKPTGKTTGEIVWEWHAWDHLIQDHDRSKANYGDVAAHPELIDINFGEDESLAPLMAQPDGLEKLRGIGYLGASPGGTRLPDPGWTHMNSIAFNPELNQIALSVRGFSEIWIIDHSTTTAEAAGHSGGRSGKGGDLLYRWGNPQAYRAGAGADQQLFSQHAANWIDPGLPGAGHLLVFNNGVGRPVGNFSSVDELVPPVNAQGRFDHKPGTPYGPAKPIWSYFARKPTDFYSELISSAQRLGNGNTLICAEAGRIFEATRGGEVVWEYRTPLHKGPPVLVLIGGRRQPWAGPATSSVFRASRYAPNYPGLLGKDLTPGKSVEEVEPKWEKQRGAS
jgi:hypothetical protein